MGNRFMFGAGSQSLRRGGFRGSFPMIWSGSWRRIMVSPITPEEAAAAMRAVFKMFDLWQLPSGEARRLLGEPSRSTYYRWKAGRIGRMPHDTVYRLGDLLGIHMALGHLFMEPARRYAWVKKPNKAFCGQSALEMMLAGPPTMLTRVRVYLSEQVGVW